MGNIILEVLAKDSGLVSASAACRAGAPGIGGHFRPSSTSCRPCFQDLLGKE